MTKAIRIEYSDGYGLFFKKIWDKQGNIIANRDVYAEKDFHELWVKHNDFFPQPHEEFLHVTKDLKEYFCAFKSINDLLFWIKPNQLNEIINAGFKIYELDVTDYQIGGYQIIYTKESIVNQIDRTNVILTIIKTLNK